MRLKSISALKKALFAYPDDPDKAKFEIGMLSPGEEKEVSQATSRMEMSGAGQTISMDYSRASTLRAMRAIKSWENVFSDAEGNKAMACNDKNKFKLLNEAPGFEEWVLEKLNELSAEVAKAKEEEEKNS
jgi:hypothetical protein